MPLVVSNHPDLGPVAAQFGIRFAHLPVPGGPDRAAAKRQHEAALEALLAEERIDLIVLARYMQILARPPCASFPRFFAFSRLSP